jgi:nickel/cobalt exporter
LRFIVGQSPSFLGRGSPVFTAVGYGLIVFAGVIMLVQSLRSGNSTHDSAHALTAGIGLLPCPLTISVLGFAWAQSSAIMVGIVLLSLALGISLTIGAVAVLAILARSTMGAVLARRLAQLERGARTLQGVAAAAIIALGIYAIATVLR